MRKLTNEDVKAQMLSELELPRPDLKALLKLSKQLPYLGPKRFSDVLARTPRKFYPFYFSILGTGLTADELLALTSNNYEDDELKLGERAIQIVDQRDLVKRWCASSESYKQRLRMRGPLSVFDDACSVVLSSRYSSESLRFSYVFLRMRQHMDCLRYFSKCGYGSVEELAECEKDGGFPEAERAHLRRILS